MNQAPSLPPSPYYSSTSEVEITTCVICGSDIFVKKVEGTGEQSSVCKTCSKASESCSPTWVDNLIFTGITLCTVGIFEFIYSIPV